MTKNFIAKVLREGMVDTRNYRYLAEAESSATEQWHVIKRVPMADLGTTAAIDGWEVIWSAK